MAELINVEVCFRLSSRELDPVAVTQALGISPTFALARGAENPRTGRKQPTGVWLITSNAPVQSEEEYRLDGHLRSLLDQLDDKVEVVRDLTRRGYTADFYCSCYMQTESEGTEVSPTTIRRMAALGAALGFSVWAPTELMAQ